MFYPYENIHGFATKKCLLIILLLISTHFSAIVFGLGKIGVDYGLHGSNLLSPRKTVALLKCKGITRVRLYDSRQDIVRAFEYSGIELYLGIPNELVPKVAANPAEAFNWITQNVLSHPAAKVAAIIVGNEWLTDSRLDTALLVPAMLNVQSVLARSRYPCTRQPLSNTIKVSTSHAFNVLQHSFPPSAAVFRPDLLPVLRQLLNFLESTGSFFMVNIMPYFAYVADPAVELGFALFQPVAGGHVVDPLTKLNYTNLFDLQLDAVYAAVGEVLNLTETEAVERGPVRRRGPRVVSGETGWPSGPGSSGSTPHRIYATCYSRDEIAAIDLLGGVSNNSSYSCSGRECLAQTVENARTFNQNLVRHVELSRGTPAHPDVPIEAFIFELFNEDLKPPGPEQHYGLFYPNGTAVYPINFH